MTHLTWFNIFNIGLSASLLLSQVTCTDYPCSSVRTDVCLRDGWVEFGMIRNYNALVMMMQTDVLRVLVLQLMVSSAHKRMRLRHIFLAYRSVVIHMPTSTTPTSFAQFVNCSEATKDNEFFVHILVNPMWTTLVLFHIPSHLRTESQLG